MQKTATPFSNLKDWLGHWLPSLCVLLCLWILSLVPLNIGVFHDVRPYLLLTSIYYWALFRPHFLNYPLIFVIGITYDALANIPVGTTVIILITTYVLCRYQQKLLIHQPFVVLWFIFSLITFFASGFSYAIHMLFLGLFIPPLPHVLDAVLTIILFPLVILLLKQFNPPLALHISKK